MAVFLIGRWTVQSPSEDPESDAVNKEEIQQAASEIYAAKRAALESVDSDLEWAEAESLAAARAFVADLNTFFESKVDKAELFSEQALSWAGQWKALSGRESHIAFLSEKFETIVFSQEDLETAVAQATTKLDLRLAEIDREFAVRLDRQFDQTKTIEFRIPDLGNKLTERLAGVDQVFAEKHSIDTGGIVAKRVFSLVVGHLSTKVISATATRIGLSSTTLGAGAATTAVSAGATAVIAIVVDRIVVWFNDWMTNPKGQISENIAAAITETRVSILKGDEEAWQIVKNLKSVSELHADEAIREKAAGAIVTIQNSGNLGLQFEIESYLESRADFRKTELEKMVMEEHK